ncbi:hypothetical protein FF80_03307 [Devosia sp. LC5]|uniref:hypothetical protein n=1 Tax=Devosia sp. LC5 TaxID=1502724 RepID=UPI0004E43B77|nr:hypothetical protein [Devosia sp. LC5]KFC62740.1 hypothetical protein FF80_03307 [Devosia sp. LC5]
MKMTAEEALLLALADIADFKPVEHVSEPYQQIAVFAKSRASDALGAWKDNHYAPNSSSLTEAEKEVLEKLVYAWNLFVALPVDHPDGAEEFRHGIHALQCQIMARPTVRALAGRGVQP